MPGITNKKQFITYVLILAAIVVMVNIVSRSLFFRLDFTDNKMYSLSRSSKDVIGKLDDRMVAKVYFSKDLPGQVANARRYLQDMLEEYEAYSNGNFHFEFISPDDNESAQNDARGYGIPPVQMQVVENDKLEIKNIYMGLVLLYNDKKETIPMVQAETGLEYDLTMAIKKITSSSTNSIAIANGSGKDVSTQKLAEVLRKTYKVSNLNVDKAIPVDNKVLLLNGFRDSLSEDELYNLDQYIMAGGRVMISQARQDANLQQGYASDIHSNIFDFLAHYGISIGKDMIMDQSCGQIQIQQNQGFFRMVNAVDYPVFPMITNFNKDALIVNGLESARLFFPNEILPSDSLASMTWLMKTSDHTGELTGPYYNIYPLKNPAMKNFNRKGAVVAAEFSGSYDSYFKTNPKYNSKADFRSHVADANIIVIGDLEFFNDNRAGGVPENVEFIQNGIDYLSGDAELVSIRSRGVTTRPLDQVTDGQKQFWKWTNILLPALLVILMGLYRMKHDRDRRKMLEEMYG